MFDMPADISPQLVSQQCQIVYQTYVHRAHEVVAKDYQKIQEGNDASKGNGGLTNFVEKRETSIKRAAQTLGAQAAVQWRTKMISAHLENPEIQHGLDVVFDFSGFVNEYGVIYPVIEEATNAKEVSLDGQSARSAALAWQIVRPARIVSVTPTWRDYLLMPQAEKDKESQAPAIRPVPESLMPVDSREDKLWLNEVCSGFSEGVRQANLIFSDNVMRLVRDYQGMLRFARLVEQKIVSEPQVMEGRLGITMAKSNTRVLVDDRMVQITMPSKFNDAQQWEIIETNSREDLIPIMADPK